MRSTFEIAPRPPATSLALPAGCAIYCRLASPQRAAMRPTMPMAMSTSALRRLASARPLRVDAASVAAWSARASGSRSSASARSGSPRRPARPGRSADGRRSRCRDRAASRADRTARPGRGRTERSGRRRDRAAAACRRCGSPTCSGKPHERVIDPAAQRLVERAADAHQDAAADRVEHAEAA